MRPGPLLDYALELAQPRAITSEGAETVKPWRPGSSPVCSPATTSHLPRRPKIHKAALYEIDTTSSPGTGMRGPREHLSRPGTQNRRAE